MTGQESEMSTHVTGIELCAGPPMLDERACQNVRCP